MTSILSNAPIIPVVTIDNPENALALADVFLESGIGAIEVTLRTEKALECAKIIKKKASDLVLGIGTIVSPDDVSGSIDAGADFLVSPGASPLVEKAMLDSNILALPGVATPTEAMARYESGFKIMKLFPAEVVGGVAMLKSINDPLPHLKFMPTGGVRLSNMISYYSLPNVISVGGTWIATREDISNKKWSIIAKKCQEAVSVHGEFQTKINEGEG